MDPITLLAALGPLAVDLGKSLIGRFIQTDVYKPTNVAEYTQMRQTDLEMFKAMNNAGAGERRRRWHGEDTAGGQADHAAPSANPHVGHGLRHLGCRHLSLRAGQGTAEA